MERSVTRGHLPALVGGVALGVASVFVTTFGLIAVALTAILVFACSIGLRRLDFLGGYLLEFGLLWSFLIGRMIANGVPHDNDFGWIAFGFALVAIGVALILGARLWGRRTA